MSSNSTIYPPLRIYRRLEDKIMEFEKNRDDESISELIGIQEAIFEYNVAPRVFAENGVPMNSKKGQKWKKALFNELYDITIVSIIMSDWAKSKQVYVFSKDFYDILSGMDEFQIDMSVFKYLPFPAFYLEIENHKNVEGVLVKYKEDTAELAYCIVYKLYSEETAYHINTTFLDTEDEASFKKFFDTQISLVEDLPAGCEAQIADLKEMTIFILQACMYLCANNADIEENEFQKKIYKPTSRIRNRFSEIRKWDVGMRVVKEYKRANEQNVKEDDESQKAPNKERQRPRQHWRRAHWHTYWVGEGRTKKELKFIAPILVNDIDDELPVVKHE